MYKCKEIIALTSQNMDTTLPWATRIQMQLHFLICKTCNRYAQQLLVIQKALTRIDEHPASGQLSDEAKQRIAKKMQQADKTAD